MLSPSTATFLVSRPFGAGPSLTEPSVTENLLPWQGQLMVPSAISLTVQPACGQITPNALNSPFLGWVTTVSPTITPPPTGTFATVVSAGAPLALAPPPPPAAGAPLAGAGACAGAWAGAEVAGP